MLSTLLTLFLAAITVNGPNTVLRSACEADGDPVAELPKGTAVAVKFAMAGQGCYKVSALRGETVVEGYVSTSQLDGLDEFEKLRKDAAWLDAVEVVRAAGSKPSAASLGIGGKASPKLQQAAQLIEASQPGKALEILESEMRSKQVRDPAMLALAGVAAWRADDPRRALGYWQGSLELAPNPDIERLYKKVEKEVAADRSFEKLYGLRVILRFEPGAINVESARGMLGVLDEEFSRIIGVVGCPVDERIVAIMQSKDAYYRATDAAEWSGGQFDGRIRVPILDGSTTPEKMRRVFAHEITHACLSMMGRWPAWFHEGVAQKLSGETLTPAQRKALTAMAEKHLVPKLENLRQDWSRMSPEHASMAYQFSLLAAEMFFENWANYGLRNLVRSPEQLATITQDLDKRLGL